MVTVATSLYRQAKLNDKAVLQAKRMADDWLLPEEIRKVRESLGLTQAQAAKKS